MNFDNVQQISNAQQFTLPSTITPYAERGIVGVNMFNNDVEVDAKIGINDTGITGGLVKGSINHENGKVSGSSVFDSRGHFLAGRISNSSDDYQVGLNLDKKGNVTGGDISSSNNGRTISAGAKKGEDGMEYRIGVSYDLKKNKGNRR